jgi:hypothetical protein
MKLSEPSSLLTWVALVLLLNAASGSASEPRPRATPQSHRETTIEPKRAYARAEHVDSNSQWADALTVATPSKPTDSDTSASPADKATDEERHWKIEEGNETRSLQIEQNLVRLTAILAAVNIGVMAIYFFTMLASIRAANAAKESAQVARDALELLERAYVDVQIRNVMVGDQRVDQYTVDRVVNISYQLQNLGRTTAFITTLNQEIHFSDSKSPMPEPQPSERSKVRRPISIAQGGHWIYGVHKKIEEIQQRQMISDPPTLFAHFFLYVGYKDALPGSREPIRLAAVIAMKGGMYGELEPYADTEQNSQEET